MVDIFEINSLLDCYDSTKLELVSDHFLMFFSLPFVCLIFGLLFIALVDVMFLSVG